MSKGINTLRKIHLYLGCIFAPMMILFTITGCWQTFNLHHYQKNSNYKPPAIVAALSDIHTEQRFSAKGADPEPSTPFRVLVVLMSLGFLLTVILGVVMAFQFSKNLTAVWLCLLSGVVVPMFILWMARGFK